VKGEVVYLYAFDVANEIVTSRVQDILSEKPFPFEIRVGHTFPKDVPLYRPLAIQPTALPERMQQRPVRAEIRVYDVGVVAIALRVDFEVARLAELMPFHEGKLDNGRALGVIARELCTQVCDSLRPAMVRGVSPTEPEAYTTFCLTDLGTERDVNHWLAQERREVAGLLTGTDSSRLSEAQVAEVLRVQRSYESTDLVVIDWDAALVVDLTGYVDDALYVLELANLQLEEFRVMDQKLDGYLNRVFEDLDRRQIPFLGGSTASVLRTLRHFRVDVARLADEVTHITKFFGDWHLARVYLGARDRFYLDQWRQSVQQRLEQLDRLYSVLSGDVYDRRMLALELIIVVLFVIDILGLFFFKR
jgi:hypothetical protein